MQLIRYRPGPPLDGCIECFWWSERGHPEDRTERLLPSGTAQLVLPLHDRSFTCLPGSASPLPVTWSRGIVHGPQSGYYSAGPKPAGAVAGVSFRPGGAAAILGVPANELTDLHVPLEDLWGLRGRELHEALREAPAPAAVFQALERTLTRRLQRPLLIHPAVAQALRGQPGRSTPVRVREVQRESGYSPRHFAALFRTAVGLTPKHYYRIRRFTVVVRALADDPGGSLADLAASAGYADQPHMIRDFRDFAGLTPTQYRPRDSDAILHHRT